MDTNDVDGSRSGSHYRKRGEELDIRKGPWTEEEDSILIDYVKNHGEGHWNFVARSAGLKRTGKSCRFRWLNYLRPGIRHGNFTLQEQLKILELHFRWGNRWSKIAECLHGRTDNDIKNYWRTRVQKQAKQLKCEGNSREFRDALRNVLMPRLAEKIRATSSATASAMPPNHDQASSQVLIDATAVVPPVVSSTNSIINNPNYNANKPMCDNTPVLPNHSVMHINAAEDYNLDDIWHYDENLILRQHLFDHDDKCLDI